MVKKMKENKYHKVLSWLVTVSFIISLIPVFYLCSYVHASGDDYHYGTLTHAAWLDTHSLWEVFKAGWQTIVNFWYGWQGTWFTIFLMTLQPEVFSPNAYWIVPIVMVGINVAATSLLTRYLLVKRLGMHKSSWCVLNVLMMVAMIQFFPHVKSGIFWWNGAVHYIVPWVLAMLAIYGFWGYIDTKKFHYWLIALLSMFGLGGSSYLSALLAPIILIYLWIIFGRKRKYSFWLGIPLVVEAIGLVVSFVAPGNSVRGGDEFGFSVGKVCITIGMCFLESIKTFETYIVESPFLFLLFWVAGIAAWEAWNYAKPIFKFSYPLLFVLLMYCTWCAMFAPQLYSGAEVSGGVPNTIMQVFIFTVFADIIYVLGWLYKKLEQSDRLMALQQFRKIVYPVVGLVVILIAVFCKGTLKETTFFNCVEYVVSGQADDYKMQMDERMAIMLDDSQRDVELPAMNPEQGPIMHMEVMEDPEAWTNVVIRNFYRKERVVQVKRKS